MKQRKIRKAVRQELDRYNTKGVKRISPKFTLILLLLVGLGIGINYSAGSLGSSSAYKNDSYIEDTNAYESDKFIQPTAEVNSEYVAPSLDDAKDYNVLEDATQKVANGIYDKFQEFKDGDFLLPEVELNQD